MIPAIEKAAAFSCRRRWLNKPCAVVGVSIGIPVIVGVNGVTATLKMAKK